MFSIVIPLYNKEQYIAQAVQSVLNQSYAEFELIVVNDGSTDGSRDILNTFHDPRLRIIDIENSGVSEARNTAIRAALFPWIGFLDADDWWAPNFLSEIKATIENFSDKRLFASGRSLVYSEETKRYHHELLPADGTVGIGNYFQVMARYLPLINSSNSVIDKSLFEEKGYFRPGQKKHEDHDLWIRLAIGEPVVFVNKPLSFYRKTEANPKAKYTAEDLQMYLSTLISVRKQLKDPEKTWFQAYLNNFVFLTYLKHYWSYNKADRKEIFYLVSDLLPDKRLFMLKVANMLPFNVYPILKAIKG